MLRRRAAIHRSHDCLKDPLTLTLYIFVFQNGWSRQPRLRLLCGCCPWRGSCSPLLARFFPYCLRASLTPLNHKQKPQPTPFLSDPTRASTTRCKRRWNDLVLLRLDALAPGTYAGAVLYLFSRMGAAFLFFLFFLPLSLTSLLYPAGPKPRFADQFEIPTLVRERYLLFVQCLESKPGQEPKHPCACTVFVAMRTLAPLA